MKVSLVGAGPGDPGLITVRALDRIQRAQALVYDRHVSEELVAETPRGCRLFSRRSLTQARINELLIAQARRGRRVVRLKGGDPFVFGRGGEEALALLRAGIPFEVVPGVSSFSAVPAAAGIPVTHRGLSAQVTVVTAQGTGDRSLDYAALVAAGGTLLVFMALEVLDDVAAGLIAHGADPSLPAAVVSRGTCEDQEVARAPLREIARAAAGLRTPALLVVGKVVDLAALLAPERAGLLVAADG